jgi:hypothetical protein
MDKDIIIAVVLVLIVLSLGILGSQMLMGIFVIFLIVVAETGYKLYLKLMKKSSNE